MPAVAPRRLDYDDYVRFPDDGMRYEILDGVLAMSPSPSYFHQRAHRVLFAALANYTSEHGGEVLSAPIDVILGPHTVLIPDIVFVAPGGSAQIEKKGIVGPPDLVVEILSPSTRSRDLGEKRDLYERAGIHAYWVVDLDAETVLVFRLSEGRYGEPARLTGDDAITSALLPGFALPAAEVFAT